MVGTRGTTINQSCLTGSLNENGAGPRGTDDVTGRAWINMSLGDDVQGAQRQAGS